MSFLDNFRNIVNKDLEEVGSIVSKDVNLLFDEAKKLSVIASNEVEKLEAELIAAKKKAVVAAQDLKVKAEAAAAAAVKKAEFLAVEVEAAAKKVAGHLASLPGEIAADLSTIKWNEPAPTPTPETTAAPSSTVGQ